MSNETKGFGSRSIQMQCLGQEIISMIGLAVAGRGIKRIDAALRQKPDRPRQQSLWIFDVRVNCTKICSGSVGQVGTQSKESSAEMASSSPMDPLNLIDRYQQRVRNFILMLIQDPWIANDLTQNAFVRAMSRMEDAMRP